MTAATKVIIGMAMNLTIMVMQALAIIAMVVVVVVMLPTMMMIERQFGIIG